MSISITTSDIKKRVSYVQKAINELMIKLVNYRNACVSVQLYKVGQSQTLAIFIGFITI